MASNLSHHLAKVMIDDKVRVAGERREAAAHKRAAGDGELERIMRAAAAGDKAAWSALVERFGPRVRAVARAHRLAAHDVEDVVQTTWLRLFEHIDKVREPRALGAWLETTGRRESLRLLRQRQREFPTENEHMLDEPVEAVDEQRLVSAERGAVLAERRAALSGALARLPARQRALVSMLFAENAPSYQTITTTLGLPIGSIGPTRGRALSRLRRDRNLVKATQKLI